MSIVANKRIVVWVEAANAKAAERAAEGLIENIKLAAAQFSRDNRTRITAAGIRKE
jgi:hypothetical protein